MTLIVGIKCKLGVVVASDGAATLGRIDGSTIRQEVKKLRIVRGKIIVGTSGPVGLGQRFAGEMEECYDNNELSDKEPYQAMTIVSQRFRKHIQFEQGAAQAALPLIGGNANSSWISSSLVALPVKKQICLFEFDHLGAPEQKTDHLPFVSIGSGQYIADPFLAFQKRLLWGGELPSLGYGIFSAVWTIQHAIDTSPGGVSEPIQVVILREASGGFEARELNPSELEEHKQVVKDVEKNFAKAATELRESAPPPPSLPK